MKRHASILGSALLTLLLATPARAQDAPQATGETINLFFDCSVGFICDLDFLRRQIPFVNWVRDRADADLHVLVTSQGTGGGGRFYTLNFLGLRGLAGQDQIVAYTTAGDATQDEQRSGAADRLALGLVRYVQGSAVADRLRVTYEADTSEDDADAQDATGRDDPWDYWVFRLNASGNANGQSTSTFSNWSGRVSANRTTEAWKIDLGGNFFRNAQEFNFTSEGVSQTVREVREDWGMSSSLVRSIGERWAIGVSVDANSSTLFNQDVNLQVKPGVEFNFFPYSESSRRSLTLLYLVGPSHFDYAEPTIFGRTTQTLLQESLTTQLSLVQPWGRWSTSVTGAHYLHDLERYSVTVFGNANVRLFRGFSVFVTANYQWVRDQLYLSAAGATSEQVLLRQRQLETSYRYFYNFGIEYRFGSIFNNVVNPRFGGGGGQVIFF
jgi:hypothetical protein